MGVRIKSKKKEVKRPLKKILSLKGLIIISNQKPVNKTKRSTMNASPRFLLRKGEI